MSALSQLVKLAGLMPKTRRARWPGGRDPERYREYIRAYMRKYRAKK
jgi:hypothetical protein